MANQNSNTEMGVEEKVDPTMAILTGVAILLAIISVVLALAPQIF